MNDIDAWLALVARELGVPAPADIGGLLDISKDVAHQVARPATPLTTYMAGAAVASGSDLSQVRDALQRCLDQWPTVKAELGS